MKAVFFLTCLLSFSLAAPSLSLSAKNVEDQKKKQSKTTAKKGKKGAAKRTASGKVSKAGKAGTGKSSTSYRNYKIRKGDQLIRIARIHGTTVQELTKVNPGLNPTNLKLGTVIKIPVTVAAAKKPAKEKPATNPASDETSYVVKEGDTLYSLSKRFNISEEEIRRLNKLSDDTLVCGNTLTFKSLTSPDPEKAARNFSLFPHDESDYDGDEEVPGEPAGLEIAVADESIPYSLQGDELKKLVNHALDYLGTTYKYGGSSVSAIDCSAFVKTVFKEVNIPLPRTSREQFTLGSKVELENLREGDLLFFSKRKRINHVAIYIGNDMYIHAARRGKGVVVSKIDNAYFKKYFTGAKRIFKLDVKENKPLLNLDSPPDNIQTN